MYQDPSGHAGLLSKVVGAVKSVATTVTKTVSKAAKATATAVKTVATKVTTAVTKAVTTVKTAVTTAAKTVSKAVSTAVNKVATTVQKGVQAVTNKVSQVVNTAKVAVQNATTYVVNKAKDISSSVVSYVGNVVSKATNTISNFVSDVGDKISTAYNSIRNYVSDKVETVKAKVSTMWEEVKDSAHKLMARGEAFVQEKYESASRWWQDTKEKASRVVDRAKNFVEDMSCSIKEGLHEASEKIKDTFDKAVEGAKSAWNSFTTFVSEHKEAFIKIGVCVAVIGVLALSIASGGAAAPLLALMAKGAAIGFGSFFLGGVAAEGIDYLSGDRSNKEGLFGRMFDRAANWGVVGTGVGTAVGGIYAYSLGLVPGLAAPAAPAAAPGITKVIDYVKTKLTIPSSYQLRNNMYEEGIKAPEYKNAAHHIVAGMARLAQDSRDVLTRFGIGINDAVNGVFLPTVKGVSNAAYHNTLHTEAYYKWVNSLLSDAQSREEVINILKYIADCLTKGDYIR